MAKIYAEYIDHMGNDDSVVNAARVSFAKVAAMFTPEQNDNLIQFLARGCSNADFKKLKQSIVDGATDLKAAGELIRSIRNQATHWVPFAHTAVSFRCSAPVPIRTHAFKQKQGFVENEESRRYITSRPEYYIPECFRAVPDGSIKQGSAGVHPRSDKWLEIYKVRCIEAIDEYERMIADGVCPEQARFVLPQGVMVTWIWTGNIYALANFVNKRTDPHAQKEVADLAYIVSDIVAPLYPVSWEALTGHKDHSHTQLSK